MLYCYRNAKENGEYINAKNEADLLEKHVDIDLIIDNTENVSVAIDEDLLYVTEKEFKEKTKALELMKMDKASILSLELNEYAKLFTLKAKQFFDFHFLTFRITDYKNYDSEINLRIDYTVEELNETKRYIDKENTSKMIKDIILVRYNTEDGASVIDVYKKASYLDESVHCAILAYSPTFYSENHYYTLTKEADIEITTLPERK